MIKAAIGGLALLLSAGGATWEHVARLGPINVVYVDPGKARDNEFLAKVVTELLDKIGREKPAQIDFFDDREKAPGAVPYKPEQRRHQFAKFNFNPANGMKKFIRFEPPDPEDPNGKPRQVEEQLPLP